MSTVGIELKCPTVETRDMKAKKVRRSNRVAENKRIAEIGQRARDFLEYEYKRRTVPGIAPPKYHQYYEALDHIKALLNRRKETT